MANLTLTAYNSKYSNRRFVEKRDMENGFKQSGFRINHFVCEQEAGARSSWRPAMSS